MGYGLWTSGAPAEGSILKSSLNMENVTPECHGRGIPARSLKDLLHNVTIPKDVKVLLASGEFFLRVFLATTHGATAGRD